MTIIRHREADAAVVAGNGNEPAIAGRSDLDLVRSAYKIEFDRARPASLDASAVTLLSTLAPSVHLEGSENDPEASMTEGSAGVERLMRSASESWDSFRFDLRHLIAAGDGQVIAAGRCFARGRDTGPRVEVSVRQSLDRSGGTRGKDRVVQRPRRGAE